METIESKFGIAVVMSVLNEEEHIGRTLDQIYMQQYPMDKVEVVIADGGSTDKTRAIAESFRDRFGSLKIMDNPRRRAASGRNIGLRNSTAPYILCLDAHTYLPSGTLLGDIVNTFKETGARCLGRPQPITPPDLSDLELSIALCRTSALGHTPYSKMFAEFDERTAASSTGGMYERSVFDEVGYFDENLVSREDIDFSYRLQQAGLKSAFSEKLAVFYYPRPTIPSLWRQMYRFGRGRYQFSRKHKLFPPVHWLASATIALTSVLVLLAFISVTAATVAKTLIGFYLLMVVFLSAYLAQREKRLECLLYGPLIFPVIHFGLSYGFLWGPLQELFKGPGQKTPNADIGLK